MPLTSQDPADDVAQHWQRYCEQFASYLGERMWLLRHRASVIGLVQSALYTDQRGPALHLAQLLETNEKKSLLKGLLHVASSDNGYVTMARQIILELPRAWLLAVIEQSANSVLTDDDPECFRRLLELFSLIDRDLTVRLAERAYAHTNKEICEAGGDFLQNPNPYNAEVL